ncbi:MAG: hypothetical protein LBF97_08035 [Elusimicrobiota bacterium]|jgi:hypothetical protein|nr:hypothetical protein [Elusimicrobiota bacterium]
MNQDLKEAIKIYAIGSHKELNNFLLDKSKDNLIAIFNDLLTTYINDKNSSTLREYITTAICGYQHSEAKIGYNGYRQKTISGKIEFCEVKPKNIDSKEVKKYKNKERKSKPSLLNAGGNFTDYTWDRFDKDLKNNPNMLISGFVDGRLIYVFEFPFKTKFFVENLEKQLNKKFQNRIRKENDFLRSASFTYKNFINDKNIKLIYILNKKELNNYKGYIDKNLFLELLNYAK